MFSMPALQAFGDEIGVAGTDDCAAVINIRPEATGLEWSAALTMM